MNERLATNTSPLTNEARAIAAARHWPSLLPQRCGGLSLEEYAVVLASREQALDDARIELVKGELRGDQKAAMAALQGQAERFKVQYLPWDFERSNRIDAWDKLIVSEPRVQSAWKVAYVNAWIEGSRATLEPTERETVHHALTPCVQLLWNCVMPLAQRRAGATAAIAELLDLAKRATRAPRALKPAPTSEPTMTAVVEVNMYATDEDGPATTPHPVPADLVVFPGQRLASVSDFAAITRSAQAGDFAGALARAGLTPSEYAEMCARFNGVLRTSPEVDAVFRAWVTLA